LPFFLWLRLEVGQKLMDVHRFHLGTQMRDAGQEVSLHHGAMPQVSSLSLAEHLLGNDGTMARSETPAAVAAFPVLNPCGHIAPGSRRHKIRQRLLPGQGRMGKHNH
jgi:hypothetical protein